MAHLLVIDDDPVLIPEQVRQAFPPPRYRVEVSATGADGLDRVRSQPPDVILLDLRLPDQSGLDVYRQVRAIDARIPVIFATTAKGADAAIEAMKQGAYDYLFKPLDLEQLRRVVGEAVEVARRMRRPAVLAETDSDADAEGAILGCVSRHARGVQGDRSGGRPGRAGTHHRRERHRQGGGRPRDLPARPSGEGPVPGARTARPFRKASWRASCSATRKARSPAPTAGGSASSNRSAAAPSFSTKSATCPRPCR